ncbi:MAG: bifunctional phosphoribosylaminoimidazolecarboxamide formyltransferase/IMP cyclohydrolase [Anaerolineae bacterium]|nr:bifunctional phosphoribosylaminoimidazolecarboxamide formyltransferase/IMP cyclohydrolase [Anaerolineae bacterium]
MTMRRALISVSDKAGLVEFARGLSAAGVELIASGGTASSLSEAGIPVRTVEDLTGLPGVLGGRVKTLHPAIFGGILAREDNPDDRATVAAQGWDWIDLVVCNLYPFVQTVSRPDVTLEQAIENIDIGGPSLIRAAAKNHDRVAVITSVEDYAPVLAEVQQSGDTSQETRRRLALRAFAHTAAYDSAITAYLSGLAGDDLPETLPVTLPRSISLRYGENPHQQAALYASPGMGPLGGELLQGKELSYNNLLDLDAAWAAASDFSEPAVVIVKHLGPCGIATGDTLAGAFGAALASDPISAFGGVIAVNRPVDEAFVEALGSLFVEAIAAPGFSAGAVERLAAVKKNCRLLRMGALAPARITFRSVRGGVLAQTVDHASEDAFTVVSKRQPTPQELKALRFAWQAVKFAKSNAIVFAVEGATVGIGGGLPSRVDSVRLAAEKAGERARGAVLASDAFFPFPDGPQLALEAGVTAIVQPGGSVRDEQVIEAVDAASAAMVFTGVRHFRH